MWRENALEAFPSWKAKNWAAWNRWLVFCGEADESELTAAAQHQPWKKKNKGRKRELWISQNEHTNIFQTCPLLRLNVEFDCVV